MIVVGISCSSCNKCPGLTHVHFDAKSNSVIVAPLNSDNMFMYFSSGFDDELIDIELCECSIFREYLKTDLLEFTGLEISTFRSGDLRSVEVRMRGKSEIWQCVSNESTMRITVNGRIIDIAKYHNRSSAIRVDLRNNRLVITETKYAPF